MWDKTTIHVRGRSVEASAPVVISASRSTDIPAFYMDWFMQRLHEGYVRWVNPFNRKNLYISFEKTRAIVFWSKNPRPLLHHIDAIVESGLTFYVQFTLNDYEEENLEPNVPHLRDRIDTFIDLSDRIGAERVIWRFDPLILIEPLDIATLTDKIERVGEKIHPYTHKLVFSFADIDRYKNVSRNLTKAGFRYRDFTEDEMRETAKRIASMCAEWGIETCSCGESIDLSYLGIKHNKCIDGDLLLHLAPKDRALRNFLVGESDTGQIKLFQDIKARDMKDRGQRKECMCIYSKDIGSYDTCPHLCTYCYANKTVRDNALLY